MKHPFLMEHSKIFKTDVRTEQRTRNPTSRNEFPDDEELLEEEHRLGNYEVVTIINYDNYGNHNYQL